MASSAGVPFSPSTYGAHFSLRWNGNSSSFVSYGSIPIFQPMHTSMATMTTTGICLSQSAHVKPNYRGKAQYTENGDTAPALPKEGKKSYKKSSALSSTMTMHNASTALYLQHLDP